MLSQLLDLLNNEYLHCIFSEFLTPHISVKSILVSCVVINDPAFPILI